MPPRPNPSFTPVVFYDPSIGKFRLNQEWSAAHSGRNRVDRVNLIRGYYRDAQRYRMKQHVNLMKAAGVKEYQVPNAGDKDWNMSRVEADYLNFQMQGQADLVKEMGGDEPGGWRGVLHDALDNVPGHLLMRGLDLASRPAYALNEGLNTAIHQMRGESPEHEGWKQLGTGEDPGSKGWWENEDTGKVEFHPEWEDISGGPSPIGVFRGMVRGFTGKEKTGFGDVLRENEILRGKPAAVVGFAGDVAFDPTTYVSFGTSTAARKGTREALQAGEREALEDAARVTAKNAVKTGTVKGPFAERRAFNSALRESLEQAGVVRRPTRQVIHDINSSYGTTSVERAMSDRVKSALKDPFWSKSTQRKIASTARKAYDLERRTLGEAIDPAVRKKVVKEAVDQARDDFTKKVGADVMDEIATRQALRENLHLDVKFAGRTIASSRAGGKAISTVSKAARGTKVGGTLAKTFRTDAEIGDALHRIQRQSMNSSAAQFETEAKEVKKVFTDLGLSKKQRQQISRALESGDTKGFTPEMVRGVEAAQQFFRTAFDREVEAGALSQADFLNNYLYHVYRNPGFSRGLGSWVKPTGGGAKKFRTLDEAISGGANPLTDVADILVHRLAKSHRVSSSHLMMRTIAARFGVNLSGGKTANKALRKLADDGLLVEGRKISGASQFFDKNVFFDQDVAASIAKMTEVFSNDHLISRFGRLFDQVQARLKFLQTAPNPGFHVRNTMSDMFVNFLDGVVSPTPYRQAIKLITGRGEFNKMKITLQSGKVLDGEDILQLYDGMGLRAGFFHSEAGIIPGMGSKFLTGSGNVIRRGSEIREDVMRMAHFIDALKKSPVKGSVEEAAELASKRVRKYNFDYQDLTTVEKKVFRRAVPFYTFMRKNVPLMVESYMTRPGRMLVPAKGQRALAAFLGNDNRDEPLPGMINATPEWISRIPGIELTEQGPENDAVFMQPDLPYNQLDQLFGGFTQGQGVGGHLESGVRGFLKEILLEQSTPLFRAPAEWATQTDLATGADQPQSPLDAIINQFPVGRIIQRPASKLTPGLFLESDRPGNPTYDVNIAGQKVTIGETLANYITGLGFRKVTPERMKSELRRRQDIIEGLLKKMKESSVEDLQEEWDREYGDLYGTE